MTRGTAPYLLALSALIVVTAVSSAAQDADTGAHYVALERRAPQQMCAPDAALLKARGAEVVRAAEFFGIDLQQGSWTYQQSVCPLMPKHLIMNYVRNEGSGVETQFAAVVPRGGEPVRVVPVQRRGVAPFTPAETSMNSMSLFNHVWAEEGGNIQAIETQSNWITLGLCYAEMVGSHPLIVTAKPLVERDAGPPTLRFETHGGASALFADIGLPSQTWGWSLEFDRHGSLKRVDRERMTPPRLPRIPATMAQSTAAVVPPPVAAIPTGVVPVTEAETVSQSGSPAAAPAASGEVPKPSSQTGAAVPAPAPPRTAPVPQDAHASYVSPNKEAPVGRNIRFLPDSEPPAGRIIPGAQELPGPTPK